MRQSFYSLIILFNAFIQAFAERVFLVSCPDIFLDNRINCNQCNILDVSLLSFRNDSADIFLECFRLYQILRIQGVVHPEFDNQTVRLD